MLENSLVPIVNIVGRDETEINVAIANSTEIARIIACSNKVQNFCEHLESFMKTNSEDYASISFQDADWLNGVDGNINAREHFENIYTNAKDIFSNSNSLFVFKLNAGDLNVRKILDKLNSEISEIQSISQEASKHQKEIKKIKKDIENYNVNALELNNEISTSVDECRKNISSIENYASEAKEAIDRINSHLEEAEQLKNRVLSFNENFNSYEQRIETHFQQIEELKEKLDEAQEQNSKRDEKIKDLFDKADKLMAASTNVGLAKSFDDASNEYAENASKAKKEFFASIAFLFITIIPLMLYLLPLGGYEPWQVQYITITGVISRLIILLPAAWVATFTAQRYSHFSDLHKEYRFKAAIAMSIDGFKRQVPSFEEEIAGTAFVNLVEKPERDATQKGRQENSPNPILNFLISTIQKRFSRLSKGDE